MMNIRLSVCIFSLYIGVVVNLYSFDDNFKFNENKYGYFNESERIELLQSAKNMFYFGYDNYMEHAYPEDELDPVDCMGRGHDHEDPSNININDALGDYMLSLVDTLDTLAIMGNSTEFKKAVQMVIDNLSFKSNTVQVFEATIRVLGALLSAHLIITDPVQPFGNMSIPGYENELLNLANDLGTRLLPAFENTRTGIPYPRVNLENGVPTNCVNETCTSGAGTLVLEFAVLSRLLGDPIYESYARRSVKKLWQLKSNVTGLLGNVLNIQTGEWTGEMSGLGAGQDSFYEYLLKSYILFGEEEDLEMFNEAYETIKFHLRRGRLKCNKGSGFPPLYVNVHMKTGDTVNNWIDSLQAAWSSVQVLNGDIEEAICSHALYYFIWKKYGFLPERYNWNLRVPEVMFYPLRPELVESTYFLYQATKNPFYLHVGKEILQNIDTYAKAECGYGTVHDVNTKELEDRMESFFLSETCKYLYLLFDEENHLNKEASKYVFSTEGHIFPLDKRFRIKPWENKEESKTEEESTKVMSVVNVASNSSFYNCDTIPKDRKHFLPLTSPYFEQLQSAIGLI